MEITIETQAQSRSTCQILLQFVPLLVCFNLAPHSAYQLQQQPFRSHQWEALELCNNLVALCSRSQWQCPENEDMFDMNPSDAKWIRGFRPPGQTAATHLAPKEGELPQHFWRQN